MTEPVDIHTWFGLTYSNYLVLPRSLLQSMSEEWQARFTEMLKELGESFSHIPQAHSYTVTARDENGKFIKEPVPHYDRGRTHLQPRLPIEETGGLTSDDPQLTASA